MTYPHTVQHPHPAFQRGDVSHAFRGKLGKIVDYPTARRFTRAASLPSTPRMLAFQPRAESLRPREVRPGVLVLARDVVLWEAPLVTGDELSDEMLVYAIARGDRDALARLYDRHATLLLGLGARILTGTVSARDVEDVLHDVFVEVWKHAGDFDPERASARTWLCLRMRSRCLDRARAAVRRRAAPLDDALLEPSPESQSNAADATRVRQALAQLPESQRQVLVLGYFQGLSSQEIADTLQIPLGTVKSRVAAALAHLRGVLSDKAAEGLVS